MSEPVDFIGALRDSVWPLAPKLRSVPPGYLIAGRPAGQEPEALVWQLSADPARRQHAAAGLELLTRIQICDSALIVRYTLLNTSPTASRPITALEPFCLSFSHPSRRWQLLHAHGGTSESTVPPRAYRNEITWDLAPRLVLRSHPQGRSSNQHLPLLIAAADDLAAGFFCGLEWSAHWYIHAEAVSSTETRFAAGVPVQELILEPGETLALPALHFGWFRGGLDQGTNALRRHLRDHVCPGYDGKPTLPRVSYDHWFGIGNHNDFALLQQQADRAAALGVEVFVHDAAWFPGGFPDGVGNWNEIDRAKFPAGLAPLAEYVRAKGMDFGLWFEIERCSSVGQAARDHPELFFPCADQQPYGGVRGPQYHLNLALREAQDWAIETIGRWIRDLDLRWSRWDYNLEPRPYWQNFDPTGKIQFAYVQGLYRVLDVLQRDHPRWMVETCASGGRRIDLGMIRRSHTIWISDHTQHPQSCRFMQTWANRFLPGHLLSSSVAVSRGQGDAGFDATAVLSRMLGKLSFDGDIASWSAELSEQVREWVTAYKQVRHLTSDDFYPLLPTPRRAEDSDALQFVAPDGGESAIFVFAGRSGLQRFLPLRGLLANRHYRVRLLSDTAAHQAAAPLPSDQCLGVTLAPRQSALWHLEAV